MRKRANSHIKSHDHTFHTYFILEKVKTVFISLVAIWELKYNIAIYLIIFIHWIYYY